MRKVLAAAIAGVTAMLALVVSAPRATAEPPPDAGDAGAPLVPACIAVSTESRYVPWGYNHIVILRSGCSKDATCIVATDVNPQTQSVEVAAGGKVEVMTFMGSPAYSFVARVRCRLH